jgi:hypothetical protein
MRKEKSRWRSIPKEQKTSLFSNWEYIVSNMKVSYSSFKEFYSDNIPLRNGKISIRKKSSWNSIDLLNLENFESTRSVSQNAIPSKPLKFVSMKWHDSNQAFVRDPFSSFSNSQLSKVVSIKSSLLKFQFLSRQFVRLEFSNSAFFSITVSKVQFFNKHP